MSVNPKEVKQRLNSIKNTKKITKAMELVAASKMRKAVAAATRSRVYAAAALALFHRLIVNTPLEKNKKLARFLQENPEGKNTILLLFSSNRGLCGAFNAHVVTKTLTYIQEHSDEHIEVIAIGKRGASMLDAAGVPVHLLFEKVDMPKDDTAMMNITDLITKKFEKGETDRVVLMYTDYISAVEQVARQEILFPFMPASRHDSEAARPKNAIEYVVEPNHEIIVETLLPRIAQLRVYQALLESNASEHSARMVAMKNATDAAGEMAQDLVVLFNRARQAGITREIAEISAAMAALT